MTDYRDIRPLSPTERAERAAQRQAEQEMAHQRILEQLDNWEWDCEKGGRAPIVLPTEIARRVLADVQARHSDRAIVKKYAGTPWAFSTYWLAEAKKTAGCSKWQECEVWRERTCQKGTPCSQPYE